MIFDNCETRRVKIGDICKQDRALLKGADSNRPDVPYIGLEHIRSDTGEIDLDAVNGPVEIRGTTFRFDQRHVLYGKLRPYLNKVAAPDISGRCSTELIPLLPKPGISREYLAAVLRHPRVVGQVMARNTGSRMPRTDMKVLFGIELALPPVPGRRRIVDILNHAASIRRLREQAKAKAREFIPALFLDMFGDPAANPRGWESVEFGQLATYTRYGPRFYNRLYAPIGARIVRTTDIAPDGTIRWQDSPTLSVTDSELKKYALQPNTILFTRTGATIGKVAVFMGAAEPCIAGAYLIEFGLNQDIIPMYGWAYFASAYGQAQLLRGARSVAQPNINVPTIAATKMLLPPLSLQRVFAERVTDIQATVDQMDRAAAAAEQLQAALMARLFDGG